MLGLLIIFLFNFFLHVFCNSTKTSANSSATYPGKTLHKAGISFFASAEALYAIQINPSRGKQ